MNKKYLLILEIIWIITGILCIGAGVRFALSNQGSFKILIFILMAAISFLFAWLRHRERKKS
jgi:hypothetical protein